MFICKKCVQFWKLISRIIKIFTKIETIVIFLNKLKSHNKNAKEITNSPKAGLTLKILHLGSMYRRKRPKRRLYFRERTCVSADGSCSRERMFGRELHAGLRTRIRIIFGIWIRIHIREKIWIRITIKSKFISFRGSKKRRGTVEGSDQQ
jgi:hypothetical protein